MMLDHDQTDVSFVNGPTPKPWRRVISLGSMVVTGWRHQLQHVATMLCLVSLHTKNLELQRRCNSRSVSAPGVRRASFLTRVPPVTF